MDEIAGGLPDRHRPAIPVGSANTHIRDQQSGPARPLMINLSVVAGRYNMLDCVAGLWSCNAVEPGPSERRAVGFLGVWP